MKVFGLAGWSGSGKTTLVKRLLPNLTGRGLGISTLKHAHHSFDIDQPGKDSYEHRVAGAHEVLVTSAKRWALIHEIRDQAEPDLDQLIAHMTQVDLVLVEGFKSYAHPKLEVYRPAVGKPPLWTQDAHIVAVASDSPLPTVEVPVLDIDDVSAIGDFIVEHCGLVEVATDGDI